MPATHTRNDIAKVAEAAIHGVISGTLADLAAVVNPGATSREATQ